MAGGEASRPKATRRSLRLSAKKKQTVAKKNTPTAKKTSVKKKTATKKKSQASKKENASRTMAEELPDVVNHPEHKLFSYADRPAGLLLSYEIDDGKKTLDLQHTLVPRSMRGQGVAARLVTAAFEFAKANDLKVIPTCSYIHTYLSKHPEWNSQVN